jgi:hypothetical protein
VSLAVAAGSLSTRGGWPGTGGAAPCPVAGAETRRLHELSIEVLTSYELAEIVRVSEGYDLGADDRTVIRA